MSERPPSTWSPASLFFGHDPEDFRREVWGRRSMVGPGSDPSCFAWLMEESELWSMGPGAERIDVHYLHGHDDRRGHTTALPEQMRTFFELGATVCVQHIDQALPRLRAALPDLRAVLGPGHRAWFNCYASADGAGFRAHFDAQHVWILQLVGHKRWHHGMEPFEPGAIRDLDLAMAARSTGDSFDAVEGMTETVLAPGDLLYLPPGTPHRAQAITRSIALTLSVAPVRALDLALAAVLDKALEAVKEHDARLWLSEAPPLDDRAAVARWTQAIAERLPDLVAELTGPELAALHRTSPRWSTEAVGVLRPTELPSFVTLVDARPLRLAADRVELTRDGDRVRLVAEPSGRALRLPVEAEPLLTKLAEARAFTLHQAYCWRGALEPEDVRDLCETLYSTGWLLHLV